MDPLTIIDLLVGLGTSIASGFGKSGLANLGAAVQAAVDKLAEVKNDPVTKAEIEAYRLNPQW